MHNINPAIEDKAVPINSVTHYDGNARKHDLPLIAASLKANTQYKPLTVRRHTDPNRDGVVLAGNGTLAAARDILGWSHIAVEYVDCDDHTAKRIVLIDNKASDNGDYDHEALAALLADLQGEFDGTGYDQTDLDKLLDELAPPDGPDDFPEYDDDLPTDYCCPKCGYEWSGQAKPAKEDDAG